MIAPENTDLLLVDFQDDLSSRGGAQHDAVMASTDILAYSRPVAE